MTRDYRWIEAKEVAALVRKRLKARWPGQKFSVRSSKFAGGSSVDVSYTAGRSAWSMRRSETTSSHGSTA